MQGYEDGRRKEDAIPFLPHVSWLFARKKTEPGMPGSPLSIWVVNPFSVYTTFECILNPFDSFEKKMPSFFLFPFLSSLYRWVILSPCYKILPLDESSKLGKVNLPNLKLVGLELSFGEGNPESWPASRLVLWKKQVRLLASLSLCKTVKRMIRTTVYILCKVSINEGGFMRLVLSCSESGLFCAINLSFCVILSLRGVS